MFGLTDRHLGNHFEKKRHKRHHHDVYPNASLGSAVLAFYVNYTVVRLYAGAAWLSVTKQWRTIDKLPLRR